jgi:hypothetical protein
LKEPRQGKTIRELKLEEMLKDKEAKDTQYIGFKFKANKIPRTTT